VTAPLVFLDTETTGLSLEDDIWEFAAIRRHPDGQEIRLHLFIDHDRAKCQQLPDAFLADHRARYRISRFLSRDFEHGRVHVVGAVPNFDTERIARLSTVNGLPVPWHHHLIDVENLAVGWLARDGYTDRDGRLAPPWESDDLSRAVGVEPPTTGRHTAMGDAEWARALYDHVMGGA
jgi:DNA polymerase III epsilon subunit-like protein